MSQTKTAEFGKWRSMLWPVHAFELKKLIPMLLLMFFINFNYTILRDVKDALVVTAPGSGAEALPFLKVWGVLPMAILFMIGYAKLSNILSKTRLFYTTIAIFLAFFVVFNYVLYPLSDVIHPHGMADQLQAALPKGFSGLVAIFRNWTYGLFYIMAELWGSMAISLLFWGFANDITKVSESKRFYTMFGIGANLAMLPSGELIKYFAKYQHSSANVVDAWGYTLNNLTLLVVVSGLLVMAVYWWMNRYVLTDARFYSPEEVKKAKGSKPKMPLKESFSYLLKSKYILCLGLLVIGYGVSIQLVEVTWKGQLKMQYSNPNDYVAFMGSFSQFTSIVTLLMMLFVGGNVIRRFGWGKAALTTPVVLLATGLIFFTLVIFQNQLSGMIAALGTTPLMLAVIFGTAQNVMSKSSKYSLFDPTKEMAYIPLDQESKVKGKAAIDVVGARFGKAGGAFINQGLILATGGVAFIAPYVAVLMTIVLGAWILAARSLSKQFTALTAEKEAEAAANAAAAKSSVKTVETAQTTS